MTAVSAALNLSGYSSPAVVLTVAGFPYDAGRQLAKEVLTDFTKRTGIRVDFVPAWGNSSNQLNVTKKALEHHLATPDVLMIDAVWPGTLASHLADLNRYLASDNPGHLAELIRNNTVDGRLVALPFYLNVGMLYYRTDLLKKNGFRHAPTTWDELERMATRIQKNERASGNPGFWGYVFQGAAYEGLTCNALEWQMSFGGGHLVEEDGTVSVNNPLTIQAFRKFSSWVGVIAPPSVVSYTESDSLHAFRTGNAAFLRYWSSGYNSIARYAGMQGRCDVALLPSGPHGRAQSMGGFQLAVSKYSKHQHEAAELVLYLTSADVQKFRAIREGYLPTLPRLYDDPDVLKAVPEARLLRRVGLVRWVARPSNLAGDRYADLSRIYYEGVHRVLVGATRPEDAVVSMAEKMIGLGANLHLAPHR